MKSLIAILSFGCWLFSAYARTELPTAITLDEFTLVGDLTNGEANFTLSATAHVDNPRGGTLEIISGRIALNDFNQNPKWRLRTDDDRLLIDFDRRGSFPIRLRFAAAVRHNDRDNSVNFRVAASPIQPVVFQGLSQNTELVLAGAAPPERRGGQFHSHLPPDGVVNLSWKEAQPEGEGKLFYSAEMLEQITVSPGLMRQVALLDCKVMQGEVNTLSLLVHGSGEVTRVQGERVLSWNLDPISGSSDRRLVIRFNQPQKDEVRLQVQLQSPLGALPQNIMRLQLRPEGATRFAGYLRVVNEGAVRLEVTQSAGLTQISPDQFPETDATRAGFRLTGSQRFVYRFSDADYGLAIQADQVWPEIGVSQLLAYRLSETEQTVEAEFELEIREAPLRELLLHIPKSYVVARLNAADLADYFVHDAEDQPYAELRLIFGHPLSGREIVELRLEHNKALGETTWSLPPVEVIKAKSTRGYVAVATDPGFRLTPEKTQGLSEISTAFFPRKVAGIQTAFRLTEPNWQASLHVERLPQSVQADVLHLFSVGEGIAYGSSLINYVVSGAPVSALKIQLSEEYFNVEFAGKDIRNWQKTDAGYLVQLHTPVSGSYTLLATYERPFKAQGETLGFTGARPVDAQTEQGHTIIISAYQFQVRPVEVSSSLLPLETGEVPAEYRLFFDAPILAAYRYAARPFDLKLSLTPLAQGDSLKQIIDRATFNTQISKDGQVVTTATYFVKNRGHSHLKMSLPTDTQLWSAAVNGAPVVPVTDAGANLIPLPPGNDPNTVLRLDLKLASRSKGANHLRLQVPSVNAPILLAEWKLQPETGQRLVYDGGSLTPKDNAADSSGFAQITRAFRDRDAWLNLALALVLALLGCAVVMWSWASAARVTRFSARHIGGSLASALALIMALFAIVQFSEQLAAQKISVPRELSFLIPVQQPEAALSIAMENLPEKASLIDIMVFVWPAFVAIPVWLFGFTWAPRPVKPVCWSLGCALFAWAALRCPNGATAFLYIVGGSLLCQSLIPVFIRVLRVAPASPSNAPSNAPGGEASAAAASVLMGAIWLSGATTSSAATTTNAGKESAVADSVIQQIQVANNFVSGSAKIRWTAERGQVLPLLFEPAALIHIHYPVDALKLVQGSEVAHSDGSSGTNVVRAQELLAKRSGVFQVELDYGLPVARREAENGFVLPMQAGLVNQLELNLQNLDVDIVSPQAVALERSMLSSNTVAHLALTSGGDRWIGWKPRSRDVKRERPVFYAELLQLFVPSAGVIEGAHKVTVRPAQGELNELLFVVPEGVSITDVTDFTPSAAPQDGKAQPASTLVSLWRFDPDTRKLRVTLNQPQFRPFSILVRSQSATGPLPLTHSVGLLGIENAAGQIGLVGFATGNEVQLDEATAQALSPLNLEDFPIEFVAGLQSQFPGLTVRRAFRYSEPGSMISLKASAVEPDVRVESQATISLGEDRTVVAATLAADITRAGIFRLSFILPAGFDVESISGPSLSHWTELNNEVGRIITLHLNGKTQGQQQFIVTLAGAGIRAARGWAVPQILLREASKQRGTLLVVPEQGLRLQVAASDGLTQLDPQKSGIKQKGVLGFRILQIPCSLSLEVEQVDPWIQVTGLQNATVTEAQVKVDANLQYQIENTGLKSFRVLLPTNAETVRFQGEQLGDFHKLDNSETNGLQVWEIKLQRRVIGPYLLQASYQTVLPESSGNLTVHGLTALDVNLQRGFLTVRTAGRLQVRVDATPATLQPAEWQSIPRSLQQGLAQGSADLCYRVVESRFELPLRVERHQAAKLLEARVNSVSLNSVVSEEGLMLTEVRVELLPGDKRLLNFTLPNRAEFWFAFVNQSGVWPWREQQRILIPLEQQGHGEKPLTVEIFYSCPVSQSSRLQDLELRAPQFDLPLENLTWTVSVSEHWRVRKWAGSFELQQQSLLGSTSAIDVQNYLQSESAQQQDRTKLAEQFLAAANSALAQGEPQQARRAFEAAYGLSSHDAAFNEDARVQLHNIKLQEALVGLNLRQAGLSGENGNLSPSFRDLRDRKQVSYTQQDAKDMIDRNSAEDNAAFMRLAEKLIQQQDAVGSTPTALRARVPEQGRLLTFRRAVVVDPWADLRIELRTSVEKTSVWLTRVLLIGGSFFLLMAAAWAGRRVNVG